MQGHAGQQPCGERGGEQVAGALHRAVDALVAEGLGALVGDDDHLQLVGSAVGLGRAGHHHPFGARAQQGAGGGHRLAEGVDGHLGQAGQFETVGGHAGGDRQQLVAVGIDHAVGHVDAAVMIAHHRVDDDLQLGVLLLQGGQPVGQHPGLAGAAEVADQHRSQHVQGAAGFEVGQIAGKPVVGDGAAVDAGIVRRVAEQHRGHDGGFETGTLQHGPGHVVPYPAVDHHGLHRHHVQCQRAKCVVMDVLTFFGVQRIHGGCGIGLPGWQRLSVLRCKMQRCCVVVPGRGELQRVMNSYLYP